MQVILWVIDYGIGYFFCILRETKVKGILQFLVAQRVMALTTPGHQTSSLGSNYFFPWQEGEEKLHLSYKISPAFIFPVLLQSQKPVHLWSCPSLNGGSYPGLQSCAMYWKASEHRHFCKAHKYTRHKDFLKLPLHTLAFRVSFLL